ncbi:MAG TPA: ABC transporter permease [Phototrophicaceae bacterium]|nr:ABC transporter permease [Phototrophicaceae bacterium]
MTLFKQFVLPRLVQYVIVIFVGVTITFLIPRLSPINPVDQAMSRLQSFQNADPESTLALRNSLQDLYGLNGNILTQYVNFWKRLVQGDLGPSFIAFPQKVTDIISTSIWWTVGLLGTTTVIAWLLGLILGSLSGYFPNRWWSELMDKSLITIYPIPYYILAFILLILFTYYLPIFPLVGGGQGVPRLTLDYIGSVIYHSFLPALSLVIASISFRFIISKALTSTERSSDYVQYAEMAALPKRKILFSYVIRNTMLPQVTDLGLSLGTIFEGALITEVVFGYPGLGTALYNAINSSDYNLIMGITLLSIVGIATASLLIDLSYPLFDPRIRFR